MEVVEQVVTLVSNGTRLQVDQALAQGPQAKKGRARKTEACRRRSKERQQPTPERITRSATGTGQHNHARRHNGLPALEAVLGAHGLTSRFGSSATRNLAPVLPGRVTGSGPGASAPPRRSPRGGAEHRGSRSCYAERRDAHAVADELYRYFASRRAQAAKTQKRRNRPQSVRIGEGAKTV